MSSLTGNLISSTYQSLLKVATNNTASANLSNITDGAGNATALSLSTTTGSISGDLLVAGTVHSVANVVGIVHSTSSVVSGSLVIPTSPATSPVLGSIYTDGTALYVYNGSSYQTINFS